MGRLHGVAGGSSWLVAGLCGSSDYLEKTLISTGSSFSVRATYSLLRAAHTVGWIGECEQLWQCWQRTD